MQPLINVFDSETSGMPDWKNPSEAGHQPHIVEIASLLCDAAGNVIDRYQAIVRPAGWEISPEMTAIHGITHEQAMDEGIPEIEALDGFLALHARASISAVQRKFLIGYNRAARLIEAMEMAGVVTAMNSHGAREVVAHG